VAVLHAAFNHVFAVLDRGTAEAIATSSLVRELGAFQVCTTSADDDTWTGRYLRGQSTYLELFGEGDIDAPVGATGVALSPDRAGGMDVIEVRLRGAGGPEPARGRRVRLLDDGQVPWFEVLSLAVEPEMSAIWVMEYDPIWLADPRSGSGPASGDGDVSRRRSLAGRYDEHRPLVDVVKVHLNLTPGDLEVHRRMFTAAGLVLAGTDRDLTAEDGTTAITMVATSRPEAGLRKVELSLNRNLPRQVQHLGSSCLAVGPDATATWDFDNA
jgi:hypothetical protein